MMVGQSISHYKIVAKLGEGGMGVVYKAEDTKLERTVALKFLAQHLLDDEEAKERFLREAKAAAALDHPNICTVYEIDEVDGKTFIAMAFLEGESLEEHISEGPLSIKDALDFARQTADGLQAAHTKGVLHRDIKPANILISPEGRATIMDFGLARLTEASRLTKFDTAMGTVAYMSPEQAQGMKVDSRTDVWALGCVLYEMVSGQRPFQGVYDQALLYEIVHEVPAPLTSIRAGVPMELEFAVGKCLEKDADSRYQQASEVGVDLRNLQDKLKSGKSTVLRPAQMTGEVTAMAGQTLNPVVEPLQSGSARKWQLLAAGLGIALLGSLAIHFGEAPPEQPLRRFSIAPQSGVDADPLTGSVAVSPNGKYIAFAAESTDGALWVQDLDQDEPRELVGTEGAILPFWSPDSEFIAFAKDGDLWKMSVHGGAVGLICPLPNPEFFQGTWSPIGDSIVFSSINGTELPLYEVSAQGGVPEELVTRADLEEDVGFLSRPHFLPAEVGRALLFTVGSTAASRIYAKNLDTGQTADLGPGDRPVYSPSTGHIIYQSQRGSYDLWARSFSPRTLRFGGAAFPIRQNARQPSLSSDDTLVYLDGSGAVSDIGLVWVDRTGRVTADTGMTFVTVNPLITLSPDGQSVAYREGSASWVQDLSRGSRVMMDDSLSLGLSWSPDGERIAFIPLSGTSTPVIRSADGSSEPVLLESAPDNVTSLDWSSDGRIVLEVVDADTGSDLWYLERDDDGAWQLRPFLATTSNEVAAQVSPNGRYLAYLSDESGRSEVYVQPFPGGGQRTIVSTNGGRGLRWSRDGRELFFREGRAVVAVDVSTEEEFSVGTATRLFDILPATRSAASYDVSPDGQQFLVRLPRYVDDSEQAKPKIRVVENWYEEFRDREQD